MHSTAGVSYAAAASGSGGGGGTNNNNNNNLNDSMSSTGGGNLEAAVRMQQAQQAQQMERLWKPPPVSMTLRAALLLLQPAVAGDTVYLMDADYLQNWLVWGMNQAVPPMEARRVREALRLAALAQGLVPPPLVSSSSDNMDVTNNKEEKDEQQAEYYNYYGSYTEPGPVDATALSVEGHPLVLQPTVRVMRKQQAQHHGTSNTLNSMQEQMQRLQVNDDVYSDNNSPPTKSHHRRILSSSNKNWASQSARMLDDNSGDHTEAAATYSEAGAADLSPTSMMGTMIHHSMNQGIMNGSSGAPPLVAVECLVVPEAFYETLRSVHGVLCEDGFSVSFQPGEREAHLLHHQIHHRKAQSTAAAAAAARGEGVVENNEGGVEVVIEGGYQQQQHHPLAGRMMNGNHYHHNGTTSSRRPIEFRRKIVWQILPPRPPAPPPTEPHETPQSVAAMLLQKANLFKANNNKNKNQESEVSLMDKLLHQEELRKQPRRIPVPEIHPIKLQYRILQQNSSQYGSSTPSSPNTLSGLQKQQQYLLLRPADGFALVSKETTAVDALAALMRAAQPQAATQTLRLWCKRSCGSSNSIAAGSSACSSLNNHPHTAAAGQAQTKPPSARNTLLPPLGTVRGDAYEWVDLSDLTIDRAKTASVTANISSGGSVSSAASSAMEQLVVADWVLRQVVPKRPENNNSNNHSLLDTDNHDGSSNSSNNNKGDKKKNNYISEVECLIECRATVNAPWPRQGMELENRVQVGDFVDAQDVAGKWYEAVVLAVGGDTSIVGDDATSKNSKTSGGGGNRSSKQRGGSDREKASAATAADDSKKDTDTVLVHYLGWASRWNALLKRHKYATVPGPANKLKPIAPLWSRTRAWREQIRVGDVVEVRDSSSIVERPKWYKGIVKKVGRPNDPVREVVGGADVEVFPTSLTSRHLPDASDKKKSNQTKEPLLLLARTQQILVEVDQEKTEKAGVAPTSPGEGDLAAGLTPQPPFLRWVNLFGEEVCELGTHLKVDDEMKAPALLKYECETGRKPVEILKAHPSLGGTGFVRESLRGAPPAPGSVGLHNLGNSCFLNSTVQCLNHMEPITQYFLRDRYGSDLNRKNPLGSGGNVAVAYASLLKKMWGGEYSVLAPRLLKQTVATFAPQFDNSYQHDSQEFCSFLLDGIHEDLNRVKQKPYVEELEGFGMKDQKAAIESWRKHLLRHDSIIVDHCQGMHRSHLTCPQCGRESIKFDIFSSISLPLAAKKDRSTIQLSDCIEMFMEGEQLDERNAWYCPKCRRHVCALKMIALWSAPDILILHLKRFTFDTCMTSGGMLRSKVDDKVEFPIEGLDLTKYILGPVDPDAPPVYNLFGVSEHVGPTANSGHYTATVRNSIDGQWYRCNDSHVGGSSGEASITGGAYVLFYQRVKGLTRWAGMEKVMKEQGINPYGGLEIDKDGFKKVKSKKGKKQKGR